MVIFFGTKAFRFYITLSFSACLFAYPYQFTHSLPERGILRQFEPIFDMLLTQFFTFANIYEYLKGFQFNGTYFCFTKSTFQLHYVWKLFTVMNCMIFVQTPLHICIIIWITYRYLLSKKQNFLSFVFHSTCFCDLLWSHPTCSCCICNKPGTALREQFCQANFSMWMSTWIFSRGNSLQAVCPLCVFVCVSLFFEIFLHYPLLNNVLYTVAKYSDGGSAL